MITCDLAIIPRGYTSRLQDTIREPCRLRHKRRTGIVRTPSGAPAVALLRRDAEAGGVWMDIISSALPVDVTVFGAQGHLLWWQECMRAIVIFIYGLALVRMAGRRVFGKW